MVSNDTAGLFLPNGEPRNGLLFCTRSRKLRRCESDDQLPNLVKLGESPWDSCSRADLQPRACFVDLAATSGLANTVAPICPLSRGKDSVHLLAGLPWVGLNSNSDVPAATFRAVAASRINAIFRPLLRGTTVADSRQRSPLIAPLKLRSPTWAPASDRASGLQPSLKWA